MRSSENYHRYQSEQSRSNSPRRKQEEKYSQRFKLEQTRTLMLQDVAQLSQQVERIFTDLSINIGTSIPDDVEIQGDKLFLRYPSIEAASSVFQHLRGEVSIANKKFKIQYFPIRKVDLLVSYDWYCDKCDYKNFARRARCYRCQTQKNGACRLSYSAQASSRPLKQQPTQNCSLMIRGSAVAEVQQGVLLQLFEAFAPVRDIRQIKNKLTGALKDFAFIQFFSPEQTTLAFKQSNSPDFKINGQKVTVMYSRNKSDDDYFKPLPYESSKKQKKNKDKSNQQDNYYHRQRQREIEEQKARPTITMDQLKQKREHQLKKNMPAQKQMSQEQSRRRQAQLLAKQWQKQMKVQTIMYICPACSRKFQNAQQMKMHQKMSKLHKFHMARIQNNLLAL